MPRPDLALVAGGRQFELARRLPSRDIRGVYRMRRLIEPELSAQSCLLIPPAELDRLEAHIPFSAPHSDHVYAAHRAFHLALIKPAATRWDLRILRPLWAETDGLARMIVGQEGASACEVIRSGCTCTELIEAYRTRDPATAREASLRYLARGEQAARSLARAVS